MREREDEYVITNKKLYMICCWSLSVKVFFLFFRFIRIIIYSEVGLGPL